MQCFGLLRKGEDRWEHLKEAVTKLQEEATARHPKAQVKLICELCPDTV